jgi:hypothetical protein
LSAEVAAVKESAAAELKRVKSEAEAAVASAVSSAIPQSSNSEEIAKVEAKLASVVQLVETPPQNCPLLFERTSRSWNWKRT